MKRQLIVNLIILFWLTILTYTVYMDKPSPPSVPIINNNLHIVDTLKVKLLSLEATPENVYMVCNYYGIKNPEIVTSQAILESGNFNSRVFKEYNNPFGLYDSSNKDYYKFNHWIEAVPSYKDMVESKYKEGDYYVFLEDINYAEDPHYIKKLKEIVNDKRGDRVFSSE